jgi:aryl-alcohol dehydrogenase-like predicted oxidoreductase
MSLEYYLLGRSGLRVSRFTLGTMGFGTQWGWGADESVSRAIFDRYVAAGGNVFDTANGYTDGESERMLGRFVRDANIRDQAVISTKFTFADADAKPGPNGGGNHRKNIVRSLEASLRRLNTDYVDLYLMHFWDQLTSADEVMRTFDDLVRSGKVRYIGFSNVPAWYAGRAQTIAEWRGYEPIAAMQMQYSLAERSIEHEYTALAQALGIGIMAWSPLATGLLSGKYRAGDTSTAGRLNVMKALERIDDRKWAVVAAVEQVAKTLGRSMSQVALNWAINQPGIDTLVIAATRVEQLEDNLGALDFEIPPECMAQLDRASALPKPYPHTFTDHSFQSRAYGDVTLGDKPKSYRRGVRIEGQKK